jgi:hypothetical protein
MASSKKCPPGVLCLSNGLVLTLLGLAIVLFIGITILKPNFKSNPSEIIIKQESAPAPVTVVDTDDRYRRAPQPLRDWMSAPEFPPRGGIATIPINIPTQGLPEMFQSVGVISTDGDALPLYGRRTGRGNDRWNYYTRTNTFNPVPVPIRYKGRDCMDSDIGCEELFNGETIDIDILHKKGKVRTYRFDGPKYIPGMI